MQAWLVTFTRVSVYYKNSALWVLLPLFYRECARGCDELRDLLKVTLRVIREASNSEMAQEMVCMGHGGEVGDVASIPNPEPERFLEASLPSRA